jgi:hypothetical protein
MSSTSSPRELSRVPVPAGELRGRWLWTLDALAPLVHDAWKAPPHHLPARLGELADLAAIFAQLDWNNGIAYPPDTPLVGRADLLSAVVDGGRRTR